MANEVIMEEGLDALVAAGRRLLELDPERFRSIVELCRPYVSVYDRPDESEAEFLMRCVLTAPRNSKASA